MAVGNFLLFVIVDSLLLLELPINSLQPLKFEGFNLNSFKKDDSLRVAIFTFYSTVRFLTLNHL